MSFDFQWWPVLPFSFSQLCWESFVGIGGSLLSVGNFESVGWFGYGLRGLTTQSRFKAGEFLINVGSSGHVLESLPPQMSRGCG